MSFAAAAGATVEPEWGLRSAFAAPALRAWDRDYANARYGQLPQMSDHAQHFRVQSWRSVIEQYKPRLMPPQEQVS